MSEKQRKDPTDKRSKWPSRRWSYPKSPGGTIGYLPSDGDPEPFGIGTRDRVLIKCRGIGSGRGISRGKVGGRVRIQYAGGTLDGAGGGRNGIIPPGGGEHGAWPFGW